MLACLTLTHKAQFSNQGQSAGSGHIITIIQAKAEGIRTLFTPPRRNRPRLWARTRRRVFGQGPAATRTRR